MTGTGTEVGKTWVAARVLGELRRRGLRVVARKPAQSFEPGDATTDADELARATGEDPLTVCPPHRRYPVPMAPPMAADALGADRIALGDLVAEIESSWTPADLGLVELAGGTRSPMAHDGDGVALLAALDAEVVVLVADAGLGTIHSVMSSLDSLAQSTGPLQRAVDTPAGPSAASGGRPVIVHLNRYDDTVDLHRRNLAHLAESTAAVAAGITTSVPDLAGVLEARPRTPTDPPT